MRFSFLAFSASCSVAVERAADRARQVAQADSAEYQHQDRHDRHVADHPPPDQLEPPHRLGDDRVDRLLLDVRRQQSGVMIVTMTVKRIEQRRLSVPT